MGYRGLVNFYIWIFSWLFYYDDRDNFTMTLQYNTKKCKKCGHKLEYIAKTGSCPNCGKSFSLTYTKEEKEEGESIL